MKRILFAILLLAAPCFAAEPAPKKADPVPGNVPLASVVSTVLREGVISFDASGSTGGTVVMQVDPPDVIFSQGANNTAIAVVPAGSPDTYVTCVVAVYNPNSTTQLVVLDIATVTAPFTPPVPPTPVPIGGAPAITSPLTATVAQGSTFSYQLTASGTPPLSFTISSLPAGLTANSAGLISGTVSFLGNEEVTLEVTNAVGTDTETLVITGTPAPVPPAPVNPTATHPYVTIITDMGGTSTPPTSDQLALIADGVAWSNTFGVNWQRIDASNTTVAQPYLGFGATLKPPVTAWYLVIVDPDPAKEVNGHAPVLGVEPLPANEAMLPNLKSKYTTPSSKRHK